MLGDEHGVLSTDYRVQITEDGGGREMHLAECLGSVKYD
jgi:hypothetical protein